MSNDLISRADGRPIICAAGEYYIMKRWWVEGLPCLSEDGDLCIPAATQEQKVTNIYAIRDNLQNGTYDGIIPEEDLTVIKDQIARWLRILDQ